MIKSFKCKDTEELYETGENRRFKAIERVALRKLDMIHAAVKVDVLRIPPANHLELLKGDREGQYSIRINDQWRICFSWAGTDAFDVEIVDYH
ncbi:MAG: type II toxin-antitoxin system RelE/ParE family toxin [Treponemataceae bacterium]|nr:type II toxin-antitoxin system RelE/ParE family toxin [Treponemataceae bacterium]